MSAGNRAVAAWAVAAVAAFVLLPWYSTPSGLGALYFPASLVADFEAASGLARALLFRQPALLLGLAAALLCLAVTRSADTRVQAVLLVVAGFGGAAGLLAGAQLPHAGPRLGFGWGASVMLCALLVLGAFGLARGGACKGDLFTSATAVLAACVLAAFVAYPLLRGLWFGALGDDARPSLEAAMARVGNARLWGLGCLRSASQCGVAWNTLILAVLTAVTTTVLGTLLALVELRSGARLGGAVRVLAPLPFVTPPFVAGLALVLAFDRSGLVNQLLEGAFDLSSSRWLHGLPGLWLAQAFAFTPVSYLIMRGVVQGINPSLEDAARTLRAAPGFTFRWITGPLLLPGLTHALLVGFLESVADFGNPIILGGQYAVLSTEIFFAIVGAQFDQGRAAALSWVLALFALGVFMLQRAVLGARQFAGAEPGVPGRPLALPPSWRRLALALSTLWLVCTLALYLCAVAAAFVEVWGRDYTPTLRHVRQLFAVVLQEGTLEFTGLAWASLFTTLKLAALAALLTAAAGLLLAWLLERNTFPGRAAMEFTLLGAFAIPGTVLGLSYTLVFNAPPIDITGTSQIIVLCLLFRSLPVAVGMGTAAFRQVHRSLDEVSLVLGASTPSTLVHVLLPLLRTALIGALSYGFVRSVTTVSTVVFLVTAETELATTFIIGRVGQGEYGIAFAYCVALVVLLSLVIAAVHWLVGGPVLGRAVRPARFQRGAP